MEFTPSSIPAVIIITPKLYKDHRGDNNYRWNGGWGKFH